MLAAAVSGALMRVTVVQIRIMRMRVHHRLMPMRVHMRLAFLPIGPVRMAVMRVVGVFVFVLQRFMRVFVHMALRQVQPDPERHQRRGGPESGCRLFAEHA